MKAAIISINRLRMKVDGEGVTTLVAMLGCPLRCRYCLNPVSWDESVKGKRYSPEELYEEVKIDNLYFLTTNGGIVFGGGEPLLQSGFIKEFCAKYRNLGWKFGMETSLNVETARLDEVIEFMDYYIVDIKDMNPLRYETYTGAHFEPFKKNLDYLLKYAGPDKIFIRIPQIPYFHYHAEWEESEKILSQMGFQNIEIFPYVDVSKRKELSLKARNNALDFIRAAKNTEL
ncbi:MAG: radical SAM protein [Lachnospiraceae bacterium]|nr:radical SAM protein [Lachnospiraceae bacterium]